MAFFASPAKSPTREAVDYTTMYSPGGMVRDGGYPLSPNSSVSVIRARGSQLSKLEREVAQQVKENMEYTAHLELRHLEGVEQIKAECDSRVSHVKEAASKKTDKMKGIINRLSLDAEDAKGQVELLATQLAIGSVDAQKAHRRVRELEAEMQQLALRSSYDHETRSSKERQQELMDAALDMTKLRQSRDALSASVRELRAETKEAREARGREAAVNDALQREADGARSRLLNMQGSLAESAGENIKLTRDLEQSRISLAACRREMDEASELHETAMLGLRDELRRVREQRDHFGEEATTTTVKLRRTKQAFALQRLRAVLLRKRAVTLATALQRWQGHAELRMVLADAQRKEAMHVHDFAELTASMRYSEDRCRKLQVEVSKLKEGRKQLVDLTLRSHGCDDEDGSGAPNGKLVLGRGGTWSHAVASAACLSWRGEVLKSQCGGLQAEVDRLRAVLERSNKEHSAKILELEERLKLSAVELEETKRLRGEADARKEEFRLREMEAQGRIHTLRRQLYRIRLFTLGRVLRRRQAEERELDRMWGLRHWSDQVAIIVGREETERRSRALLAPPTPPSPMVLMTTPQPPPPPPPTPSTPPRAVVDTHTQTAAMLQNAATMTSRDVTPAPSTASPVKRAVAPPPPPPPQEVRAERRVSAEVVVSPRKRPSVDTSAWAEHLAALRAGDLSSLPSLMQQLRLRIAEELYSVQEHLSRVVEADHLELYGKGYRPLPVTEVERMQFHHRLVEATHGTLKWLVVIFLRAYESVKALLREQRKREREAELAGGGRRTGSGSSGKRGKGRRLSTGSSITKASMRQRSGGGGGEGTPASKGSRRGRGREYADGDGDENGDDYDEDSLDDRDGAEEDDEDEVPGLDLASLRLGPASSSGEKARAARVLRNRLCTLLEDAKDVWMQHRRGASSGSPTGAAMTAGSLRTQGKPSSSSSSRRRSRTGSGSGGGHRSCGGRMVDGTYCVDDDMMRPRMTTLQRQVQLQLMKRDHPDLKLEAVGGSGRRSTGASEAYAYVDTGAGPRLFWEAIAGHGHVFADASWDMDPGELEEEMWSMALLVRCQDPKIGLRLRRDENMRKVLDQRMHELILLYLRTCLIWEGAGDASHVLYGDIRHPHHHHEVVHVHHTFESPVHHQYVYESPVARSPRRMSGGSREERGRWGEGERNVQPSFGLTAEGVDEVVHSPAGSPLGRHHPMGWVDPILA